MTEKDTPKAQIERPLNEEEQLFFMHIPKTAGTSLIAVLDQRYAVDEICPLDRGTQEKYLSLPEADRERYKFIRGHFPYSLVRELKRPRTLTFLRDPVKRTLSAIKHHRRLEEDGISFFKEFCLADMTIEEIIDHPVVGPFVCNKAVQYLNDITSRQSWDKQSINLSQAKERLETFDFIGFTERFEDSLLLLSNTFCLHPIKSYQVLQAAPEVEKREPTPQHVLERLIEMNQDEIVLYQYGLSIFNDRFTNMKSFHAMVREIPHPALVSVVDFDFRRVDPGRGWHVGEVHPTEGIIRWSGPDNVSYLDFPLDGGQDLHVQFRIINAVAPRVLFDLVLEINGQVIDLVMKEDGFNSAAVFEGRIPEAVLNHTGAPTTLAFKVSQTYLPGEFQPANLDERKLGLCYNWLRIFPEKNVK